MNILRAITYILMVAFFSCGGGDTSSDVSSGTDTTVVDTGLDAGCTPACENKSCGDDGCGGTCGTCTEERPFCTPVCFGQECGDDGCGGSCGECPDGAPFCVKGACSSEQCQPQCLGKACGDDGCGGTCGECASANHICQAGICIDPCDGVPYQGCCDGDTVKWCYEKETNQLDCSTTTNSGALTCGWNADKLGGVYDCVPEAGDDPSGTHSSTCP